MTCQKVKSYVGIESLKFHPDNPRTIRSDRLNALKESIVEKGFYQPIIIDKANSYILSGNHRVKAVKELIREGYILPDNLMPVVIEDCDESTANQILFESNNSYAEWIDDKVREALSGVQDELLSGYGFTDLELKILIDRASEEANESLHASITNDSEDDDFEDDDFEGDFSDPKLPDAKHDFNPKLPDDGSNNNAANNQKLILIVSFDSEDEQQDLFLELRDRGYSVKV